MARRTAFAWYARRVAAMSPREIVHRLREQARRRALRPLARQWDAFDAGAAPLAAIPVLSRMMRAPLPDGVEADLRGLVGDMRAGRFAALGRAWPPLAGGVWCGPDWMRDPVTGGYWPGAPAFSFTISYRHNAAFGDVKYIWEANRLQALQAVAVLAARDGDPALARFAIDMVSSWMEANPPFTGVNWTNGIEGAMRLITLAILVAGVGDALSAAERLQWRRFVAAHAFGLQRFPSLYSSANNHRVAEGLGLVTAALLAPDLDSGWLGEGRAILEDAVSAQYWPDGTSVEQSPTYAAFTLELLCVGAVFLDGTPHAFGAAWQAGVARAASSLRALLDDQGFPPRIGDDDEGRVIGSGVLAEPRYVASVVSAAAMAAARPDLAPPARDGALRDLLFGVPACGEPRPSGIDHYPQGGLTIIRERFGPSRALLVFDHGPLGFGGIAAHGHADALSLWLHVDGVPVLVDGGTYLYHAGGAWREFFRSTAAHNTVEIAAQSQSLTAGAFNWRHKAQSRCVRLAEGDAWEIEGTHDGYRARLGVVHARTLKRTANGFCVEDRLAGARKPLPVAIRFLVHPALDVAADANRIVILRDARPLLSLTAPSGLTPRIVRGDGEIIGPGWYSPAFGERVPASCIVFEGLLGAGEAAVTQCVFPPL